MLNIIISLLTFILIIISLFMVLVILMQRASANAGMGSAFGGGVAESAFGAETTNILTRATKWAAVAFFIIALALYLMYMSQQAPQNAAADSELPDIPVASQTAAEAESVDTEATVPVADESAADESETETPPAP